MLIGVVRERQRGETRVAATPATVTQLRTLGYEVVVDPGAGLASSFPDAAYVEAGATIGDALAADVVFGVNAPSSEQLDGLREGATVISILSPGLNPGLVEDLAGASDHGVGDGCGAADLAGAVVGCVELDGQHRRLPGGDRGGARVRPVLHRSGDGGGQGAAGQGVGRGGRGRGSGCDRCRGEYGCDRAGDRPAARGCRPGAVAGWGVPVGGGGRCRGLRDRLCQGDVGGLQPAGSRPVCRAGQRRGHHHHHGPDSREAGAAADHRRDGGVDEVGQCDRGHGRVQRRQRRGCGRRRGGGHRERGDDHRLHRPRGSAADPGVAAVRHQPGEPDEADDPGQGRQAGAGLRRRRPTLDDRGPQR